MLVLDDVQWADPASLALLAHLVREAPSARMLVAVTYRPAEIAADGARADLVGDLARLPGAVCLELSGLGEREVAAALADRLGVEPSPQVVATVTRRTRGNPFFVGELSRVLRTDPEAAQLRVPAAVRDVVRRRLARLQAQVAALSGALRDGGVLSRRETEIADLVGRGLTNRQIATTAHISERTVETHVQHVLAKLGFSGRSQIAAWVARRGQ